ncbi:MAG TPA: copper chaperone PCu(A)C [Ramlibacter sp.]|jgi:copper(I)-binding protein|uniref:copper chaperone PCu(A)C n=1 Tax=Ramlibacter sp. TaxID=1917967 RepID=UPI002D3FF059|nr:copper chaperone PCu(A)C [Ramlibacter sp.]HZY17059.1 copper chaperone PCu(A)C [Ramlibacter sp.]
MRIDSRRTLLAALGLAAAGAWAQTAPVTAVGAWARASMQGQTASAAYMTLTATEPLSLVGVSSPVARVADVHEMKLEGEVMRMRALPALELPANRPVQLKPGGYHLMLQELKAPLQPDTTIPVTLTFRTARGEQRQLALQVPVSATPPREPAAAGSQGGHKH